MRGFGSVAGTWLDRHTDGGRFGSDGMRDGTALDNTRR